MTLENDERAEENLKKVQQNLNEAHNFNREELPRRYRRILPPFFPRGAPAARRRTRSAPRWRTVARRGSAPSLSPSSARKIAVISSSMGMFDDWLGQKCGMFVPFC